MTRATLTPDAVAEFRAALDARTVPQGAVQDVSKLVEVYDAARELEGNARREGRGKDKDVRARVVALDAMAGELHASLSEPARTSAAASAHAGTAWRSLDSAAAGNVESAARMLAPHQSVAALYARSDAPPYGNLGTIAKMLTGTASAQELETLGSFRNDMTSSSGGGVLVPEPIAGFVIDLMRARTVTIGLGARTVPMDSKTLTIPRVTADPTPAWLTEGATITPGDGDLDSVDLTSKRLTAIVKFSDELDEDSDPELAGEVLANSLARSFAVELDRAALRGSGVDPEPRGIRNQTGVTIVAAVGAADWTTLTGFKATLEGANSECTGFVLAPRTLDVVENTPATDGHFVEPPSSIADIPRRQTTSVPIDLGGGDDSEIYAGAWSDLLIGMRVQFELRRLEERYAEEGKVALRARIRADVQLAHGASFVVGTGVTN